MTFKVANLSARYIFFISILICITELSGAAEIRRMVGPSESRLKIYDGAIISNSDTLILNERFLIRDKDYQMDYLSGVVQLQRGLSADSTVIVIRYTPLPHWLRLRYGLMPAPRYSPDDEAQVRMTVSPSRPVGTRSPSNVDINGTKRFSILTQKGGSQFDQSLELSIKGEVTPGLEIIGVVADRGYDPVYGTINSRISEVDKLNIQIKSSRFGAQAGNLAIRQRSGYGGNSLKEVSGVQGNYRDRRYSVSATIARPRGRSASYAFLGQDRVQGPYRVLADGQIKAIIPGSEKVWLDGELLERGADKDYMVDYPAATITFATGVAIDSRSRIEIDFEPLLDDYLRELYDFSGGVSRDDSSLYFNFGFSHESDDSRHLRSGELNQADRNLLQSIGDSVVNNFRDGAVSDTGGAYLAREDSAGNRYYEYVGTGSGDYSVVFTSVGSGQGDYIYQGDSVYSYVGGGKGDYRAAIKVPVPSGENLYETSIGWRPIDKGTIAIQFRHADLDKNLLSSLDDENNAGQNYQIVAGYGKNPSVYSDSFGVNLAAEISGKNYRPYARQIRPDQARQYFIPDNYDGISGRKEFAAKSAVVVYGPYNFLYDGGYLDYADQFHSYRNGITLYPEDIKSYYPQLNLATIRTGYDTAGSIYRGQGDFYGLQWKHELNQRMALESKIKYERRQNNYQRRWHGTTEKEINLTVWYDNMNLRLERYDEDTLESGWQDNIIRNRATFAVPGRLGDIKYDLTMIGQRLTQKGRSRNQLLGKLRYSYFPSGSPFAVNGVYSFSDENRFERGIRYVEVDPGRGNYSYRDGQYVPDANGNYIELEEVLSEQAEVSVGEKSLEFSYIPNNFYCRFQSSINEEMLKGNDRNIFWVVPFITLNNREYQFRRQNYVGEVKAMNRPGYYIVNLSGSFNSEARAASGSMQVRSEAVWRAIFREQKDDWRFSQEGSFFSYRRDSYFNSPGNIDGFKLTGGAIRQIKTGLIKGEIGFRHARDEYNSRSRLFIINLSPTIRTFAGGETVLELEGYFQSLRENHFISYRLTDDYSGRRGVRWSVRADYRIQSGFRFTISIDGRHAENYRARLSGRGDLIANF
jgi:hypothetical protein